MKRVQPSTTNGS